MNNVRVFKLKNRDVFTITTKRLFEVCSMSNLNHIFVPIKIYKKIVWYNPKTWFRTLCQIEYIENEE